MALLWQMVKYSYLKLAKTSSKVHKSDENVPFFVDEEHFRWSTSMTLDNSNDVFIYFWSVFMVYTLPHS